ncbi:VanZ like family protein [Clostridium homopropionicum DSM 5847]|uniref:VanZ like family protein n=1 Tax=Clostridium homopropionicum DSM 5847 TaxID=1121318 RepID=A0A0L6Z9B3_9CLOT|nr:VanZ family protein [Clostridium homopropionicum]KOA19373.1 VanZ like family protein [Clostridium homopropionicum DSM 5847]SFG67795.1 VanZ like family protein [Clostridium homopropionicum]
MKNIHKYLNWILVLIWMLVIFAFSSDPAAVSDEKSGLVIKILNNLGIDLNSAFGKLSNFIVRKIAHFTEYFILYMLLFNALRNHNIDGNKITKGKALFFALIITFLYACSDEFHQIFVPGREGRFRDVTIDTSGGLFGMILIKKLIKKVKTI